MKNIAYYYRMDELQKFTIFPLPINDNINILAEDPSPSFSKYTDMPLLKYGFYYYIHQTKDKLGKPEIKDSKIIRIINAFDDEVPKEDFIKQFKNDKLSDYDDINSFSIKYFKSNKIISRAFYKLWELLMMFPLINIKDTNITTLHIAEAPGSFVQAVAYYRMTYFDTNMITKDKYIATSIESNEDKKNTIPKFHTDLYNIKQFSSWDYENSDLTNPKILGKFIKDHEKIKASLITADGGFNWKNENYQEQEAYILLLSEIYCAIKTQKLGGNFVIKFFEIFTNTSIKMLDILRSCYKNVLIVKPLLSRPSNSERYVVCLEYTGTKEADKIFDIIKLCHTNKDFYLVDIFPNYNIDTKLDHIIKLSSSYLSNIQHKQVNKMISFIEGNDYYGNDYRNYVNTRKLASDFWIEMFYPMATKYISKTRQNINIMMTKAIDDFNKELKEFSDKLT